jgi:hypothetical protein
MVMKKILALITVLAGCTACATSDYHTTLIGKSLTELRQCAGASEGERKEGTLTVLDYSAISPRITASRLPYAVPGLPLVSSGHCAATVTLENDKVTDVRYQPGRGSDISSCDTIFMDCYK